ncbi:hypothetical protein JJL56_26505 [Azospirillum sp. YIM DDC1]|uniref:Uncharacterized protein n=1 Tax=Azospirillum aestuarii TaxID=2802052 RepID=A0ABS1I5Q9_9PROT|nr:hypothetical protein [Azospirillum aestuarii]MBK4722410.1 hypothetical protein [Azospirillum aestuarii]
MAGGILIDDDAFPSPDQSPALDLVDDPLWLTVLKWTGLELRDSVLKEQFKLGINATQQQIHDAIDGKPTLGFLLRVNIHADEFGTPQVPGGQLVTPIGVGTEPLDALAEFVRKPSLSSTSSSPRNHSYYIWVSNKDGHFYAQKSHPGTDPVWRKQFEANAVREGHRRDLLGAWTTAMPPGGLMTLQRSTFWHQTAERYSKHLSSEDRRARVDALGREFSAKEKAFNDLYTAYQQSLEDAARHQQLMNTLNTISTALSAVEGAIKIGTLYSGQNTPVGANGQPQAPIDTVRQTTEERTRALEEYNANSAELIELRAGELQQLDATIRTEYTHDKVPIPNAEGPLFLPGGGGGLRTPIVVPVQPPKPPD